MNKLLALYRQYRQYIGTDVLMYIVFFVVLALLFVFSDRAFPRQQGSRARVKNP